MSDAAAPPPSPEAAERRSRLLGIKLRTLASEHLGAEIAESPVGFPEGAALRSGDRAWVLIEGDASRSLGGALAWARRQGARSLDLVAESATGLLARRAQRISFPVSVWVPEDRSLLPAVGQPLPVAVEPALGHLELATVIAEAGARPNVEHGVVFGEVRGLEVCRVVDQPTTGHIAELGDVSALAPEPPGTQPDGVLLEVGVGANDREAFRLLHGDIPTVEALASVVDAVSSVRSLDAPQHPLNRLGQERFMRWQLEQDPSLAGVALVEPASPPMPRPNLKDAVPCVATATTRDGRIATLVCSVGIDLDLVGFVADVQTMSGSPVIVVLRPRDVVPIVTELLGLLIDPVEIRSF